MQRDLNALGGEVFDLLVVGGGVLGACVAREAALRGLHTGLIEADDFAAGTSWNSLKIIHGGYRYLQQLDLRRMRDSIRERSTWLRIAPHLVTRLPVLVPTYGYGARSKAVLRTALAINDLVSWDRNHDVPDDRRIPRGRALSRSETTALVPEAARPGLTGGVLFHDAQAYSTERLILAVVASAAQGGAVVANHARLTGAERRSDSGMVVQVRDELTGASFDVRARAVVNAAGPGTDAVASLLLGRQARPAAPASFALNVVLRGSLGHRVAFAVSQEPPGAPTGRPRLLFVVPWRGQTAAGTAHYSYDGDPARFAPPPGAIDAFLGDLQRALPSAGVTPDDVAVVHAGILPAEVTPDPRQVRVRRHPLIVDHAADGCPSAITAVSVKFTTARSLGQRVVDLVFRKLGHLPPPSLTATRPLVGAPAGAMEDLIGDLRARAGPAVAPDVVEHLAHSYGTSAFALAQAVGTRPDLGTRLHPAAPVIRAQLEHGRDAEMACTPEDLLARRTELGPRGLVDPNARNQAQIALSYRRHSTRRAR